MARRHKLRVDPVREYVTAPVTRHRLVEPRNVRHAAAKHDHARIKDIDDRGERPGAMFADWELIGVPYRVVIGDRGLADSVVEFKGRTDAESQNIPLTQIKDTVIAAVQAAKSSVN